MTKLDALLRDHLADPESGWSMGSFGAIAEFHQDPGEPVVVDNGLARATERGGIRIDLDRRDVLAIAYETLSPKRHRWSQAIALCLPTEKASRKARTVLTELGPDGDAIRDEDRDGILFDMGLSLPQCDFCIRTGDPALVRVLRGNLGRSLFDHSSTAMPAIMSSHPHRVALTNLGRAEVYQKIGGPDTSGVSPPGPHTHVLPKLLSSGRTHSANVPIPDDLVPVAYLHPGNPVVDPFGKDRPFSAPLYAAFEALMGDLGTPEAVNEKRRILAAVYENVSPHDYPIATGRVGRAAARLALRQQARAAEASADADRQKTIARWRELMDPDHADSDQDDDAPGH